MSYDMQQRYEFLKSASTTELRLEAKRIGSKQHGSSKKWAPVPPADRISRFPDKLRTKTEQSGYGNRKYADEGAGRRDELVRYMSNLPDYLLRPEKGEKIQEKALSVGVLDWGKLESWKHKQHGSLAAGSTSRNASCSSNDELSMKKPCKSSTRAINEKTKEKISNSHDRARSDNKIQKSVRSASDFQDETLVATEGQKQTRADQDKKITKQVGTSASNRYCRTTVTPQEHANDFKGKDEGMDTTCLERKCRNRNITGDIGCSMSKSVSSAASLSSSKSLNSDTGGTVKMAVRVQDTNIDTDSEDVCREGGNIVLLFPKNSYRTRFSQHSHRAETRTLAEENLRKSSRFSEGLAPEETQFANFCSETSNPIVLPPGGKPSKLSSMVPRSQDQDTDFSSVISRSSSYSDKASSLLSETTCEDCDESDEKLVNQHVDSTFRELLHKETAEMISERSRDSSPSRRFSFSLSRIGRSFSFKEGSSLPRFSWGHSNVKSGPVTSQSSTCLDNSNKEKLIAHNRTRSSTFRRLLDPLWKHKAADPLHSAEILQSQKEGSNRGTSLGDVGESFHFKKDDGSTVRAVLHHTIKNGLPLYKFLVNNKSSILVTTVKKASSCEKDSSSSSFTFYVVDEIKKSGGWIGLGGKEKGGAYVYNVVGQMKDADSRFPDLKGENSLKQCKKEYVLLGVESEQDQGSPKFNISKELAAAVIRIPRENLIHGEFPHDCTKYLGMEHFFCPAGADEITRRTTVILPGGMHGSPNNGAPSPLIFRWRSGGSCDCGGWDVGCKVHVLHSEKQCFSAAESPTSCASSGLLELYLEGEGRGEQSRPVFSMAPWKSEMHSVEFRSPISVLQAFFICVAVEVTSLNHLLSREPNSKENDVSTTNPPLSRVARV